MLSQAHHLKMGVVWCIGDITTISKLAATVHTAYKGAPIDYKYVAEEVDSLQSIINKVAQHFTALGDNDRQKGQEVLKGCQSILEDLNSLIQMYNRLASINTSQVFQRVKLGADDITTLRVRLRSHANLLSDFIQRFDISTMNI